MYASLLYARVSCLCAKKAAVVNKAAAVAHPAVALRAPTHFSPTQTGQCWGRGGIRLYKQASGRPPKEPSILGPIPPGGLAPRCPGICLYKRASVWAEICLYKRAGVQPAKEPGILGPIRLGGLALGYFGICPYKRAGVWAWSWVYKRAATPGTWMTISPDSPGGYLPIWLDSLQSWLEYTWQIPNLACQSCQQTLLAEGPILGGIHPANFKPCLPIRLATLLDKVPCLP